MQFFIVTCVFCSLDDNNSSNVYNKKLYYKFIYKQFVLVKYNNQDGIGLTFIFKYIRL